MEPLPQLPVPRAQFSAQLHPRSHSKVCHSIWRPPWATVTWLPRHVLQPDLRPVGLIRLANVGHVVLHVPVSPVSLLCSLLPVHIQAVWTPGSCVTAHPGLRTTAHPGDTSTSSGAAPSCTPRSCHPCVLAYVGGPDFSWSLPLLPLYCTKQPWIRAHTDSAPPTVPRSPQPAHLVSLPPPPLADAQTPPSASQTGHRACPSR